MAPISLAPSLRNDTTLGIFRRKHPHEDLREIRAATANNGGTSQQDLTPEEPGVTEGDHSCDPDVIRTTMQRASPQSRHGPSSARYTQPSRGRNLDPPCRRYHSLRGVGISARCSLADVFFSSHHLGGTVMGLGEKVRPLIWVDALKRVGTFCRWYRASCRYLHEPLEQYGVSIQG